MIKIICELHVKMNKTMGKKKLNEMNRVRKKMWKHKPHALHAEICET